jgi:hypothetical protein
MTLTQLYALILHVAGLAAVVVLVALGKISWADGGPIIGALIGLAIGVPVTPAPTGTLVVTAAPVPAARPAMPQPEV